MRRPFTIQQVGLVLIYLGLGVVSALVWARVADLARLPSWHAEMVGGYAPAPNQYRPLTPWIADLLRHIMPRGSLVGAYFTLRALVVGVTLVFFHRYARVWFVRPAAAAAALCLAAILPFTYFKVVQESDPINLLVFVLAFWALAAGKDEWLFPLVAIGTLNRETTAMIPALYLLARWREVSWGRLAAMTAGLAATWAVVFGGLLAYYGQREYYCDVVMFWTNLGSWVPTVFLIALFGAMWVLAFLAAKTGPKMLTRALWLIPPYVTLHYAIALVWEVRLFLPLAPIVIPLAWFVVFPEARRNAPEPSQGPRRGRSRQLPRR